MQITFIRHAESTWNAYGDMSKNVGITKRGKNVQASKVSGHVDAVILSPLKRVKETFIYSKLTANNIFITDTCREIKGGLPGDYLEDEDHTIVETEEEIQQRITAFKTYVTNLSQTYNTIAVISHYGFIERVTGRRLHNCQVITFDL